VAPEWRAGSARLHRHSAQCDISIAERQKPSMHSMYYVWPVSSYHWFAVLGTNYISFNRSFRNMRTTVLFLTEVNVNSRNKIETKYPEADSTFESYILLMLYRQRDSSRCFPDAPLKHCTKILRRDRW
jgi:hypothetical protein